MQNAFVESFNGKFREECLNLSKFGKYRQAPPTRSDRLHGGRDEVGGVVSA